MSLTKPVVLPLVERYRLEMARYEKTAALVAEAIRAELRGSAIRRYLLSFRAKHPDDLEEKLLRKGGKYDLAALRENLNSQVTDLAGCRVLVYDRRHEDEVANVLRRRFKIPDRPNSDERVSKSGGYDAYHLLVLAPDGPENTSTEGAMCEIQITNVAQHVFNEIEHDVSYKDVVSGDEKRVLAGLLSAGRASAMLAEEVFRTNAGALADEKSVADAEALRYALERLTGRALRGREFRRLFELLEPIIQPLSATALAQLGPVPEIMREGRERLDAANDPDHDDVVDYAIGLSFRYPDTVGRPFVDAVGRWVGAPTSLKLTLEAMAPSLPPPPTPSAPPAAAPPAAPTSTPAAQGEPNA